jgi:leucyl aminopeptidase
MNTNLSLANPAQIETECLVAVALDYGEKDKNEPRLQSSDAALTSAAAELIASGEFSGKLFETLLLHRPQGLKAKRLLLVGGGKAKNFTGQELRKLAGTAVRFLKPKGIRSITFLTPEPVELPQSRAGSGEPRAAAGAGASVKAIVEGAQVANFDPDRYRSDRKDQSIDSLTVAVSAGSDRDALQAALEEARVIGESQNFTRELVNEPSNRMTPIMLAERARRMVEETAASGSDGLSIEIHGPEKIKELKMGAFWSVAQGSDEEPRLIVIHYEPKDAPATPHIGLVGKGITFDTGGISIKPSEGMEKMKYDMAGGAAMIGAMRAVALLRPKIRVTAIILATENMPSGKAQKPGDVQIAMSGKSIEVINTDAEGRMVLADGLHYARQMGCTHLVDAATLTGAVVVALAGVNAGIFANDEDIYSRFSQAKERAGEKMWRLPLDPEYLEMIRSHIADITNTGGRWGGAITAAMFLKEFVADTPWVHLDIAGTAWMDDNKAWIAKGPSGFAVRSLVEFVRGFVTGNGASGGRGTLRSSVPAAERSQPGTGL